MPLRRLLNVAYTALAEGRDEDGIKELDAELTALPGTRKKRRSANAVTGDFAALLAAAKLPQRQG